MTSSYFEGVCRSRSYVLCSVKGSKPSNSNAFQAALLCKGSGSVFHSSSHMAEKAEACTGAVSSPRRPVVVGARSEGAVSPKHMVQRQVVTPSDHNLQQCEFRAKMTA
mmetsp:Transcript_32974/g.58537  ORF Transcript_32974/g.58537 Transcript_32974/m.58537 type:complete len:108 (+) Transcript_32974:71-394(+)